MRKLMVLFILAICFVIFSVGVHADQAIESLKKFESYEKGVFQEQNFWSQWCQASKCQSGEVGIMEVTMTFAAGKSQDVYKMGYISNAGRVDLCEVIFSESLFESSTCADPNN